MDKIKLKTKFDFDSAHRLVGYDGKCSSIHGHIWQVELEIEGDKNQLDSVGILWDFSNVKKLKELFDHQTILKKCVENEKLITLLEEEKNKLYLMNENPTAENLCFEILGYCKMSNPDLKYKIIVWESPKSSCEVRG